MEENLFPTVQKKENALVEIESARAVQETQAAMIIAKKFPRNQHLAFTQIMEACKRTSLAETANYAYPRGGKMVTGPSIRLAEVLAQNWGNMQFGVRELSQEDGWSEVEAFAWDVETNTRQTKTFKVSHVRHTKQGAKKLTDPRDIYEIAASQGARRLRACILGVIPGDLVEEAVKACDETLKGGNGGKPLDDMVKSMLLKFKEVGVTQEMIEVRLQHETTAIVRQQLVELGKIYNAIKDGMSKREDWFEIKGSSSSDESKTLTDKIKNGDKKKSSKKAPKPQLSPETQKLIAAAIEKNKDAWEQAESQVMGKSKTVITEEDVDKTLVVFNEMCEAR